MLHAPRTALAALVVTILLGVASLALPVVASAQEAARPWIGVAIEAGDRGVRVTEALEGTPGHRAGLQKGDEILKIDGVPVKKSDELIARVQDKGVGERVKLEVLRAGKTLRFELALEAKPEQLQIVRDRLLGKPAPDFALSETIGAYPAELKAHAGKVVVVEFWATWCGPCRLAQPTIHRWQRQYGKKGLRIVGISDEPMEDIRPFVGKARVEHVIARDPESKVKGAYLVPAIPMMVVIDRKGIVRHVEIGAGEKLADVERVVKSLLAERPPKATPGRTGETKKKKKGAAARPAGMQRRSATAAVTGPSAR